MSANANIEIVGCYQQLRNGSAIEIGDKIPFINPNPDLYGDLDETKRLDLKLGYNDLFQDEYPSNGNLDEICHYIDQISSEGDCLKNIVKADIIGHRAILYKIAMTSLYPDKIAFNAYRVKDVIFIQECKQEISYNKDEVYYREKFNQYMTLNQDGSAHNQFEQPITAEFGNTVLRAELSFNNETICAFYKAKTNAKLQSGEFVELKTRPNEIKEGYCYENRLLKNYLQSFLGNFSATYIGYYNENRLVYKVETIRTADIPTLKKISWNKDRAITQLFNVLKKVKNALNENGMAIDMKFEGGQFVSSPIDASQTNLIPPNFIDKFC